MPRVRTALPFAAFGILLSPPAAPAQIVNLFQPGVGPLSLYRYQSTRIPFYNPALGAQTLSYTQIGAPRRFTSAIPYAGAYYGGTDAAKQQQDLLRAQRAGRNANQLDAQRNRAVQGDVGAFERDPAVGAKPNGPLKGPLPPAAGAKPELLNPDAGLVASGEAHNRLLDAVTPLHSKAGRNVESPFLPPDLAARLLLTGPNAEAVSLLRDGVLNYPPALGEPSFENLRRDVNGQYLKVIDSAGQPRNAVVGQADRLLAAVKRGREQFAAATAGEPPARSEPVAKFWGHLEAAANLMRDPATAGAFPASWNGIGISARDLTDHLLKHKQRLAPAAPGDAEAYQAAYRGLLDYYQNLLRTAPR